MNYAEIKKILNSFYKKNRLSENFEKDNLYLEKAFNDINNIWFENLNQIETVNFLMIGEAPLWGQIKKYIYNPKIKNSQFFYRSDLGDILNKNINDKQDFIKICNEIGLLIIDISPFALNPSDTIINYRDLSIGQYNELVRLTIPYFFEQKIKAINSKRSKNIKCFFRYARVKNNFQDLISNVLIKHNFINSKNEICDISQNGGGINKSKFEQIILSNTNLQNSNMDIKCHYIVKARTVFHNKKSGEIEFRARVKVFENSNLIEARKEAFEFRNEFIYGLLALGLNMTDEEIGWNSVTKQIENLSDSEIRKLLNPFLDYDNSDQPTILNKEDKTEEVIDWLAPYDTLAWYSQYNNGIWIILVHNDSDYELESDSEEVDIVIDKITKYEEPLPVPPLYRNLIIEYKLYKKYKFKTENLETIINFFDDEEYLEGFQINEDETKEEAQLRHLEECYISFKCLITPFDWTGYDKIDWWKKNKCKEESKNVNKLPITIQEAYNNGESHLVEFKPGLINWNNSERDIEREIVQTLCAFLNSNGGYLFIGIADKENKVLGIKYPDNSKDKFLREFTRIKARFLPPYLAHSINGDFYTIEEKTIFIITVFPNNEPVFLRIKDERNKITSKNFYIRSDASTRHLYDIEEIVRYCRKREKDNDENE
jgi:hypothetical protein